MQRSLAEACGPGQSFDSVVCFGKLQVGTCTEINTHWVEYGTKYFNVVVVSQACFIREATTRTVLKNAAARLKAGGYFFGFLPDSSHIWRDSRSIPLVSSVLLF
eukprot:COSAG01_NODE_10173_length_2230_cov_29.525575_1_plen_104_part_00